MLIEVHLWLRPIVTDPTKINLLPFLIPTGVPESPSLISGFEHIPRTYFLKIGYSATSAIPFRSISSSVNASSVIFAVVSHFLREVIL